ncbi:FecCD family ABC transporter permease [Nonomuraea typhae]|uniref:FecCD family ABC transporter permease n=1 Tax=Nonomuraea typhae TaxID=2603600 RepID=UPI001FE51BDA|nr:iron ABC transporter permease [Nonomuraea typhae]
MTTQNAATRASHSARAAVTAAERVNDAPDAATTEQGVQQQHAPDPVTASLRTDTPRQAAPAEEGTPVPDPAYAEDGTPVPDPASAEKGAAVPDSALAEEGDEHSPDAAPKAERAQDARDAVAARRGGVYEAPRSSAPRPGRAALKLALIPALTVLLATLCVASAGIGAVHVPFDEVLAGLVQPGEHQVLWQIRFPRVALAVLVGAALAVAGAGMQGVFGNPLAEPGVIGVSSGAAVGAVGAIVLGVSAFGDWSVAVSAFATGLITTFIVYGMARSQGRTEVVTLVLTGIAVNAIAWAIVGLFTFMADDQQLRSITFWNLGTLGGATWPVVAAVTPFIAAGLILTPLLSRSFDLLALGERGARHLGVDTERVRLAAIFLASLLTGASVAAAGAISFVGLVVPHLIRLLAGPGHRILLPASALAGGCVLLLADLLARTVVVPAELPIGVLTALLGGPFFLFLLRRTRKEQGGWA